MLEYGGKYLSESSMFNLLQITLLLPTRELDTTYIMKLGYHCPISSYNFNYVKLFSVNYLIINL